MKDLIKINKEIHSINIGYAPNDDILEDLFMDLDLVESFIYSKTTEYEKNNTISWTKEDLDYYDNFVYKKYKILKKNLEKDKILKKRYDLCKKALSIMYKNCNKKKQIEIKKPVTVWIFSIITLLSIILTLIFSTLVLINIQLSIFELIIEIINLLILIPESIFLYYFFKLNKKSLNWLYIIAVVYILLFLIQLKWIGLFANILFFYIIFDYIKNKKIKDFYLFN